MGKQNLGQRFQIQRILCNEPVVPDGRKFRLSDDLVVTRKTDFVRKNRAGDPPPPLQIVQTGFGVHQASYLMGTGSFQGQSSWGVKLTTYPHLVLRLRMSGSTRMPLITLGAFTARTAT
jgi:hypothetical protein